MNFSQIKRELGIGYRTLRGLLEREACCEVLEFLGDKDEIYLARRIEQEVHPRKVRIPKKIFLVGRERLIMPLPKGATLKLRC